MQDLTTHPTVRAVLAAFPGAQIVAVKNEEPTDALEPVPDGDADSSARDLAHSRPDAESRPADGGLTMDFTPTRFEGFARAFQAHVDQAMEIQAMEQEPRSYLGGSRLGEDCLRFLGYEYTHTPKDPGRNFKGQTLRIFDMGHDCEARNANYIRQAGFTLLTERPDGKQFGFGIAPHPETGKPRIAGHIDGVLTAGPAEILDAIRNDNGTWEIGARVATMQYPCLWENKGLNDKGYKGLIKDGVEKTKPVYYAQMQTYMAYLGLSDHPGLFTATNRNTGEMYAELVPYRPEAAQAASDKGVTVISAGSPDELPRIGRDKTDFKCKFCDYAERCWSAPATQPAAAAPMWFGGARG